MNQSPYKATFLSTELFPALKAAAPFLAATAERQPLDHYIIDVKSDGTARIVAVDGFRMIEKSVSVEGEAQPGVGLLPKSVLKYFIMAGIHGKKSFSVTLEGEPGRLAISANGTTTGFMTPEGACINYEEAFPQERQGDAIANFNPRIWGDAMMSMAKSLGHGSATVRIPQDACAPTVMTTKNTRAMLMPMRVFGARP